MCRKRPGDIVEMEMTPKKKRAGSSMQRDNHGVAWLGTRRYEMATTTGTLIAIIQERVVTTPSMIEMCVQSEDWANTHIVGRAPLGHWRRAGRCRRMDTWILAAHQAERCHIRLKSGHWIDHGT